MNYIYLVVFFIGNFFSAMGSHASIKSEWHEEGYYSRNVRPYYVRVTSVLSRHN